MSITPWPSDVNQLADSASYAEAPETNVAAFSPEVGPPKLRRRMSISTDIIKLDCWMTTAEYASFLSFFRTDLEDGVLPFTRTHPREQDTQVFSFVPGSVTMQAQSYNVYKVSMEIRTRPDIPYP